MKKFITSSLITITALSNLVGTVGVVGAKNTSDSPSSISKIKAPGDIKLEENLQPLTVTPEREFPWWNEFIGERNPIYANNLKMNGDEGTVTSDTTVLAFNTINPEAAKQWILANVEHNTWDAVYIADTDPTQPFNVRFEVTKGFFHERPENDPQDFYLIGGSPTNVHDQYGPTFYINFPYVNKK